MLAVEALDVEHRVDADAVRVGARTRADDDDRAPDVTLGVLLDLVLGHVLDGEVVAADRGVVDGVGAAAVDDEVGAVVDHPLGVDDLRACEAHRLGQLQGGPPRGRPGAGRGDEPRRAREVVHAQQVVDDCTYFVVYGRCAHAVDYSAIGGDDLAVEHMTKDGTRVRRVSRRRPIVVVGASTGTDTHSVGIDAMLNVEGFDGQHGLKACVPSRPQPRQPGQRRCLAKAVEVGADAVLVSQTVTQQDLHVHNLTRLVELVKAEGCASELLLICGGSRSRTSWPRSSATTPASRRAPTQPPGLLHRARVGRAHRRGARRLSVLLSEAVADVRRLAVVGLATTAASGRADDDLGRAGGDGQVVGVTSIGNDGEARDALDARIEKPAIRRRPAPRGDHRPVLRRGDADVEIVRRTPYRTPLGRVISPPARRRRVEVAGPWRQRTSAPSPRS